MKKLTIKLMVLFVLVFSAISSYSDEKTKRYFLFVGEPNAQAWKWLMANPHDREKQAADAMAKIGGKILSYYFGLGDGKNYITVELPDDNEVIQTVYLTRMPSGLLSSYQIIELMPSDQMVKAMKKSNEFIELEKSLGKSVGK